MQSARIRHGFFTGFGTPSPGGNASSAQARADFLALPTWFRKVFISLKPGRTIYSSSPFDLGTGGEVAPKRKVNPFAFLQVGNPHKQMCFMWCPFQETSKKGDVRKNINLKEGHNSKVITLMPS